MENFEKIERLLQSKPYQQLTKDERKVVSLEIESEEEYESLRKTEGQLTDYFTEKIGGTPKRNSFNEIKSAWKKSRQPKYNFWLITPLPTYATVLLLLAVGFLSWLGGSRLNRKTLYVEKIKHNTDTVLIASKADTVYKTKIVYIEAKAVVPTQRVAAPLPDVPVEMARGISMKDKEELEKLLVSGAR